MTHLEPGLRTMRWVCSGIGAVLSCLILVATPGAAAEPVEDSSDTPVIMLTAESPAPGIESPNGASINLVTWNRELFRQSFLIAARDEFRAATRDAVLGEPVDSKADHCFHLSVLVWSDKKIQLDLRQGSRSLQTRELTHDTSDGLNYYLPLARHAGELRQFWIDALAGAGFERQPASDGGPDVLPADIEKLLQQMNHVSQYAAVRRLHQLMRREGESVAVLGGLARGYAHLSQLTLPVLDLRHRAYGARSLLYALRMVELEPSSAVPHWHTACSLLWLGFPNGAASELQVAATKADDSGERPAWLKLVEDSIHFRFDKLEKTALDESADQHEAAALQWFLRSRLTASDAFNFEVGQQAREVLPNCGRIIAGLFDTAGVALNHETSLTAMVVQDQLIGNFVKDVKDLPAETLERVQSVDEANTDAGEAFDVAGRLGQLIFGQSESEETSQADIRTLLSAAGSEDRHEPSFHILAGNLNAWQTQAMFQRGRFLKHGLGVDADDFVQASISSLPDPQYRPLYAALGIPRVATPEQTGRVTSEISHHELNFSSVAYQVIHDLPRQVPTAEGTMQDYLFRSYHDSGVFEDAYRQILRSCTGTDRVGCAQSYGEIAEHAPLRYSEQVLYDWAHASRSADEWEQRYPGYPDLQWALARAQKTFGDIEKSIEHYDVYLQEVDDANGYIGLAEAWYVKDPKGDKWTEVLGEAFACPDYGLTHSQAAQRGASTLMRDARFEDALPWAELAAQAYSHAGLRILVHCYTGLGQFEKAEDLSRQIYQRYQSSDWYDWCASTGQGDLDAAWVTKQQLMRAGGWADGPYGLIAKSIHEAITGRESEARATLQQILRTSANNIAPLDRVWVSLFEVVLADRLGDTAARDQTLRRLVQQNPANPENPLPAATSAMAQALQKLMATGELSSEEIEQMSATHTAKMGNWAGMQAVFMGYALWTHGRKDAAVEQWKFPAKALDGWNQILAWNWLRKAGVDPIHIEGRYFPEPFLQQQYELPPPEAEEEN